MKHAMLFLLVFSTWGCVSPQTQSFCKNADWYELGRRDGSMGRAADSLESYQNECAETMTESFQAMYLNGRDRGLIEFCTPQNGYSLGQSGELYYYVCPFHLEGDFLTAFKKGRRVLALQRENLNLERKMESILTQVQSVESPSRTERELKNLKSLRAHNDKELSRIETQSKFFR